MKKQKETTTVTKCLSGDSEYRAIQEQQGWDDFLAWCRKQENCPHE